MVTRVACLQLEFQYFNTPQEFANPMRAGVERAAETGAQLVLLPHRTALGMFGMFDLDATPTDSLDELAARQHISTNEWLHERAGYVFEFYLHLFQSLAARVETWLAPGSIIEPESSALYSTAFLFNPAGEIVGRQRQMHRSAQEIAWGIAQGDTLRVFETEIGDFGFVSGEDIRYPETARALALNGANVLLHPAAYEKTLCQNVSTDTDEQFLQDLWREVQANQTFGVQANLVGRKYHGLSAIYAPTEYTLDQRGILAQATNATSQLLVTDFDFQALQKVRAAYPILDLLNREAYGLLGTNTE